MQKNVFLGCCSLRLMGLGQEQHPAVHIRELAGGESAAVAVAVSDI